MYRVCVVQENTKRFLGSTEGSTSRVISSFPALIHAARGLRVCAV